MKCLGLDIGSTSIKGAVLDLASGELRHCIATSFPAPISGLPASWVEISPDEVIDATRTVIDQLIAFAPDATQLFCCGQMGGVILVDQTGNDISNYLSWRDQRSLQPHRDGKTYLESARERLSDEVFAAVGGELQPGSLTTLLYWLAENNQLPANATPISIGDFVLSQLCGSIPRMHVTHAIGLLDLHANDWHHEAFERLGLESLRLPLLSRQVESVGHDKHSDRTIECFGAYGDQQCALFGAGLKVGELSINISTGSQVSERVKEFRSGAYQSRMFFEGDFLNTITHLPAGRSLNVLVNLLTELATKEGKPLERAWEHIVDLASSSSESELAVDLSFFGGPLGLVGGISNITTENLSVGQLFRSAFASMAENYDVCASRLNAKRPWPAIVFSGGLTQSVPLLRTLIQQRFDLPCREVSGEETLNGLLSLARRRSA